MKPFPWPNNCQAGLVLCYDDALTGHFTQVAPALTAAGLTGTFCVPVSPTLLANARQWQGVAALGHELANHTCFHPCRRFPGKNWGKSFELDDYDLERWQAEVALADAVLTHLDGKTRRAYGNTCHHHLMGPIDNPIDLRPHIAARFTAGRGGVLTKECADPWLADLAHVGTAGVDGCSAAQILARIDATAQVGGLLILTMHGVGGDDMPGLYIDKYQHAALITGLIDRRDRVWVGTLSAVAQVMTEARQGLARQG